MKKYTTIFFDLDHTLWDFERNSREALTDIFDHLKLHERGITDTDLFIRNYQDHNHRCWELYRRGEMSKEDLRTVRFELALKDFDITDAELAGRIGEEYVNRSPYKTNLLPGTLEILDYLKRNYRLHIITNGFEEVQHIKIKESGLESFFDSIITSEKAGVRKPHPDIFHFAMKEAGTQAENSVMIGDDEEADVQAAVHLGMDGILFDPHKKSKGSQDYRTIHELKTLRNWF